MLLRRGVPLAPDARMKNLFERAFFRGVAKYYCAKCGAVQVTCVGENDGAEFLADSFADFGQIDKFMGGLVGVEERSFGQQFAQAIAESALPGGNPARDPDGRHRLNYKGDAELTCGASVLLRFPRLPIFPPSEARILRSSGRRERHRDEL